MVEFIKYMKVRRLGAVENMGILDEGNIYVFEKLDGSNTQIRTVETEDGKKLLLGSRNRFITEEDGQFAKFYEWAHNHPSLRELETNVILFGEWLAPHTIKYNESAYGQFYLFDVYHIDGQGYLPFEDVEKYANRFGLNILKPWYIGLAEDLVDFMEFVGKSDYGDVGEGIVIKNYGFFNRFGQQRWAKVVGEKFQEMFKNGIGKERPKEEEDKILSLFVTPARVEKLLNKARNGELDLGEFEYTGDMRDMRWLPNHVYDDIIDEEAHYICRNVVRIDFDLMRRKCSRYVASILKAQI